ncbi:MAG: F0F1 ATP synthase subunit B [Streptosporangiaceae bacterium]
MNHLAASQPVVPGGNPLLPEWPELIIGTIAFLIVFIVLARVLMPRIQRTLAERTDAIEGGIQKAEAVQAEANRTLDQYKAQLSEARHEAARLREEAKEQGAQIIAEMREQAQAEARRITEAAQAQLAADRSQALAALRNEVGAISVELAGKIVGESLSDEARQHRLVDRFLDELEAGRAQPAGTGTASGAQAPS